MRPLISRRGLMLGLAGVGGAIAGPALAQGGTRIEAPFRMLGNQPFVQVSLNGQGPWWFLLDTGAAQFAVDPTLASQVRLEPIGIGRSRGLVGESSFTIFRARELVLAGRARDRRVTLGGLPALVGQRFRGLFPMARSIAESGFDFDSRVFVVDTRPPDSHPGYERVAARMSSSAFSRLPHPRVQVTLDGRPATLIVDTGATSGVSLRPDYVRRHGLWSGSQAGRDGLSMGSAGAFRTRTVTANSLQWGRYRFEGLPVSLGHPDDGSRDGDADFDGLLGMEVLRRLSFYLRPARDELWLKPSGAIHDVYRFNRSGLSLDWRDGRVVVTAVAAGSPGDRASLAAGDVITASSAEDGSYDGLVFALTDAPGTDVHLTVVRDGAAPRETTVTLDDGFTD